MVDVFVKSWRIWHYEYDPAYAKITKPQDRHIKFITYLSLFANSLGVYFSYAMNKRTQNRGREQTLEQKIGLENEVQLQFYVTMKDQYEVENQAVNLRNTVLPNKIRKMNTK